MTSLGAIAIFCSGVGWHISLKLLAFTWITLVLSLPPVAEVEASPGSERAWAKVGAELRALYEASRAARESGRPLVTPDPALRIVDDRVLIDAVAVDDVDDLKRSLVALGLRAAATTGRIVSGQLPIVAIPAMAELPSLKFARAAVAAPHGAAGGGVR